MNNLDSLKSFLGQDEQHFKISVIIPTFNRANYLKQSVDSVLNQTYKNCEIIIIDDGSSDETKKTLEIYGDQIKYLYQKNDGPAKARNKGILNSSGQFIAFLDSDDIWEPDKIRAQVACFKKNKEISIIYTDVSYIDKNNNVITERDQNDYKRSGISFEDILLWRNKVILSTLVARRECLSKTGLFDESLKTAEDYHFILKLARHCKFYFLNEKYARRRVHENSLTSESYTWPRNPYTFKAIEKIFQSYPEINKKVQAKAYEVRYFHFGYYNFQYNNYKLLRKHMKSALKYNKFNLKIYLFIVLSYLPIRMIKYIFKLKKKSGG